ncbi:MAG: hypothetical protein A3H96_24340 [Acidobacteria bacterium RIFCSPLOWO2_02_FULL_67_36]|nr:MAG: hypothetical protein A3H96_24340 [Acidobacteria bacterium RIFCSPLOWO2_02_FULL_67_36]OFW18981.1 MAG: hypothetical protein A3G21_04590 [Acidobacteria bacterium RIFCSPLOWO2_12_FULL_66_21]
MLSVLHVAKFYPPVPGGMERVVQSLCTIAEGRLASRVLAFHTRPSTVEEIVDGVPVTRVGTIGAAGSVPIAPSFPLHLRRAQADVIILHEPNPWALLSYAIAPPRAPLGIWFHSEVVRPALQYRLFYAPVARPAYRRAKGFAVSSPALAEHPDALRGRRERVTVIPFGIDADAWRPSDDTIRRAAAIRRAHGSPLVLFAGRLVPYKGLDVLIRAAAPLPVTLAVVGDGPLRAEWERLAAREGGRVVFTGEIGDDDLRAYFHACEMFVLPSVTRAEAFGYVQLEAMAAGKPVVSTNVTSGVPWVNRHGETGLVVAPGDAAALRAAIETLLDDPARAAQLAAAGLCRVRRDFSIEAMANGFVDFCERVARDGGR